MKYLYQILILLVVTGNVYGAGLTDNLSFPPGNCEIGDLDVQVLPCNESGMFYVELTFVYQDVGEAGFKVKGNGTVYGEFMYDELPVTIGQLAGDGVTVYEFIVKDLTYPECSNWTEIDPVDCDGWSGCNIWDLVVDDNPCNDEGLFTVYLDFEYQNVSEEGFKLIVNDEFLGVHPYSDLPLAEVGPFAGDGETIYHFLVRDVVSSECAEDTDLGPIDCGGGGGECNIWDLVVDDNPCNDEGFFTVYLDFEYQNVSGEGFKLIVNDQFLGVHPYSDLPLPEVGPFEGDGETIYHFFVRDVVHSECSEELDFGPVDCAAGGECDLSDMIVEALPCNEEGYFMAEVDLEFENVSDGFLLWVNNEIWDDFSYEALPVIVGPLEGDGETTWYFVAADIGHDDCATNTVLEPVDCNGNDECWIGGPQVTILPCNETDHFYVLLDFEYDNTGEAGFSVHGNGNDYGDFLYEDLPVQIGPLFGDGTTVYEFGITDNTFDDCGNDTYIDPVDCESDLQITEMSADVISCSEEVFKVSMDFTVNNRSMDYFTVSGNGQSYGKFAYDELPVVIGPMETDGITAYHFIVRDEELSNGNWVELIPFTCESLGIPETDSPVIRVFYRRNDNAVIVSFDNAPSSNASIYIYDSIGRELYSGDINNPEETIYLDHKSSKVLIYRIIGDGIHYSGKIMAE